MPRFDAFCGPYNQPFSANIQSEVTINWLPERNAVTVEGQGTDVHDKNIRCSLIPLPGLREFVTLPLYPCRGVFPGEFRLFAVGADHFYEIKSGGTIIDRSTPGFSGASGIGPAGGTIGNNQLPVQFFSNGNQVMLISAGHAYIDNGNGPVPAQFSDPLTDLLVDPADTSGKTLTTATGNFFDQSDVGRTIQITGGSGFNIVTQVVESVNASGEAIGAGSWGVPGSGLGTGIEWVGYYTWDDLELLGNGLIVSSNSHLFGPSDIGTTLIIEAATGWIAGSYTIVGLVYAQDGNPSGDAILDRSAGTEGSTGGTGQTPSELVTAFQGAFLDDYFFVCPYPLTKSVFYSGAPDGTVDGTMWDPLNYFQKVDYPDNVIALFADHEELYTSGDLESTEVFRDVGDANNPFMPDPGAVMHLGCQAPFSFVRLGNGVAWIAQDTRRGTRKAVQAVGYQPTVVSTPAVEAAWQVYATVQDAVAFTLMWQGHELWVITFPTENATWFYDSSTGWWGQWGYWNSSGWDRLRFWTHCVVALDGKDENHYGGDWETGQIYIVGNFRTDNGNPIVRRRRAPHLTNENMRRFYARFEVDCDVDGRQRVFWNRLGAGRDRIWQLDTQQSSESGGVTLTLGFSDDRTQSFQLMFSQTLDPSVIVSLANAYLKWTDATWN